MIETKNNELNQVVFEDPKDLADLVTMLRRIETVGLSEIVVRTEDGMISFFGCTQSPNSITSSSKTILVHRAYNLVSNNEDSIMAVVPLRSILDRLAHLKENDTNLSVPDSSLFVAWAGMLPKRTGWQYLGLVDAKSLRAVAEQGIDRIAKLLPEEAGGPVVEKLRASVWDLEIAPDIPAAAAFAIETLGFLQNTEHVSLSASGAWKRLSTSYGDVIIRP